MYRAHKLCVYQISTTTTKKNNKSKIDSQIKQKKTLHFLNKITILSRPLFEILLEFKLNFKKKTTHNRTLIIHNSPLMLKFAN